jgi:hypothetical protein
MTQPPQGPPWGSYPPPGSQPPKGRGWEIFGGVIVGGIASILVPLIVLAIASGAGSSFGGAELVLGLVIVPLIGAGLLFGKATRPWGVGILIGWAIAVIVVGGTCVALIATLGNA